jgi:heat-inducible transcriptional repressor
MGLMMTSRQEALLASIIEGYIETAEPISSKLLEKTGFFGLSSATIRAEMNELEGLGFLTQLYTSSGRVPTDVAYRYYVDNLAGDERQEVNVRQKTEIKDAIYGNSGNPHRINKNLAQVLSELTGNLVVTNILEEDDFFKVGLSGLFELPDFKEFNKMFRLTSFFDQFEEMFDRLEKEFFGDFGAGFDSIQIRIGRENPVKDIKDETVIFAKYNLPRNFTGSLTLVGPTRMDYGKNIGLIKYTTKELNKLSKQI